MHKLLTIHKLLTMHKLVACLALTTLFAVGSAQANVIVNGDFENPQLSGKQWAVFSAIPGWTTVAGPGIEIQRNTIVTAQSGNQYVELDSDNGAHGPSNSTMSQVVDTLVGGHYSLSFYYKPRTNNAYNDNGINVFWDSFGGTLAGFAPVSNVLAIRNETASNFGNWRLYSLDLIANAESMVLSFGADGKSNSFGGFLDNVSLIAKVSEPESLALLSLGLLLMLSRRAT